MREGRVIVLRNRSLCLALCFLSRASFSSESFPTPDPCISLKWFRVETRHPAKEEAEVPREVTCAKLPLDSHQDLLLPSLPLFPSSSALAIMTTRAELGSPGSMSTVSVGVAVYGLP